MSKPTKEEVDALAREIEEWGETGEETDHLCVEYMARLEALDERAGAALAIGSLLSFDFQDGAAHYLVYEIQPDIVLVHWMPIIEHYDAIDVVRSLPDGYRFVPRDVAERNFQLWLRYRPK